MSLHSPLPVLHPVCSMRGGPVVAVGPSSDGCQPGPPPSALPPLAPSISPSPSSISTHTVHASSSSSYGSGSSSSAPVTPSSVHATPPFLGHLCSPARPSPPTTSHLTASRSAPLQQNPTHPDAMVVSPPRTPTPGASGRAGREASASEVRDEVDREGVHGAGDGHGVDGIMYAPGWIDGLQVLDRVGGTAIRAISADEYAHIEDLHLSLDVPETALFPWLHGMRDGNVNLDNFFSSFPGYNAQHPAPRYRGLTVLLSPGPGDASPPPAQCSESCSWSSCNTQGRSRTGSMASSESESSWGASSSYAPSASTSCLQNHDSNGSPSMATHHSTPSLSTSSSSTDSSASLLSSTSQLTPTTTSTPPSKSCYLTSALIASEVLTLSTPQSARVYSYGGGSRWRSNLPRSASGTVAINGDELARTQEAGEAKRTGVFVERKVGEIISLRNLGLQVAKYATISDIVIYHPQGLCASALNVAERAAEALEAMWNERKAECSHGEDPVRYNVFLVTDSFAAFENSHPDLVAVDSEGVQRNKIDLFRKEAVETIELTKAREVSPGFWMGNSYDCPMMRSVDEDGEVLVNVELNPNDLNICIEAFDQAQMPDSIRLTHAAAVLESHNPRRHHQHGHHHRSHHHTHGSHKHHHEKKTEDPSPQPLAQALASVQLSSQPPTLSDPAVIASPNSSPVPETPPGLFGPLPSLKDELALSLSLPPPPPTSPIYHLQCLSTSLVCSPGDWRALSSLTGHIIDFAKWIKKRINEGRKVMVHGFDGYTETSLFALAYIMVAHQISLPEAYLHLHLHSNRAFFVYPHDVHLLRRVEERLAVDRKLSSPIHSPSAIVASPPPGGLMTLPPVLKWKTGWGLANWGRADKGASSTSSSDPQHDQPQTLSVKVGRAAKEAETEKHNLWFNCPTFEGSFPSRIVDFLYLGNLHHASNPGMLHALGITHVVSVGESALMDPEHPPEISPMANANSAVPNPALWYEHQAGRIKVLDMQSICDDGVSPLRPAIAEAVSWIEQARLDGGKILVHCKVGVSRSATVTIAYLMKHCNLSLIDAYMLTRARRLNVLIQPNLKFLYELQGWEVEISREKAEAERRLGPIDIDSSSSPAKTSGPPRAHGRKAMSWPIMAREIALLNHRYLH